MSGDHNMYCGGAGYRVQRNSELQGVCQKQTQRIAAQNELPERETFKRDYTKGVDDKEQRELPSYSEVVDLWNKQADEYNQWDELGEDEKIEWAMRVAIEAAGEKQ